MSLTTKCSGWSDAVIAADVEVCPHNGSNGPGEQQQRIVENESSKARWGRIHAVFFVSSTAARTAASRARRNPNSSSIEPDKQEYVEQIADAIHPDEPKQPHNQ